MRAGTVIHGRIRNTYRQFSGPKYAKIADTPNPPNSVPHGYAVWCRPWAKPLRSHGHHSTTAVTSTASPAPPNAFLMDCRIVMLVNDWVKPLMPVKMEKTMYPRLGGPLCTYVPIRGLLYPTKRPPVAQERIER